MALEELLYHFYFVQHLKRFKDPAPTEKKKRLSAENAVRRLQEMDAFLKDQGSYT